MGETLNQFAVFIGAKLGAMRRKMRQSTCRHDDLWTFEGKRVFLKCSNCGRQTPGFDQTGIPTPTLRFQGDPERFRMVK